MQIKYFIHGYFRRIAPNTANPQDSCPGAADLSYGQLPRFVLGNRFASNRMVQASHNALSGVHS